MRLFMTHAAIRNKPMLVRMTAHAGNLRVLLGTVGQTFVDVGMTACADIVRRTRIVCDLKRLVNRMTYAAAGIVHKGSMRFGMAFRTGRNVPMTGVMAIAARHIRRMLARILRNLAALRRMTGAAILGKGVHVDQAVDRRMLIGVAGQTLQKFLSVNLPVAGRALRNDVFPLKSGPKIVKGLVTFTALDLMLTANIPDFRKHLVVTLRAFQGCQRRNLFLVNLRRRNFRRRRFYHCRLRRRRSRRFRKRFDRRLSAALLDRNAAA